MSEPSPLTSRSTASLKAAGIVALCVLNAALLLSLASRWLAPKTAHAGVAAQGARPSEYLLLPSRPIGMNQEVVYVLDTDNATLSVAAYNQTNNDIDFVAPLPLSELFGRGR